MKRLVAGRLVRIARFGGGRDVEEAFSMRWLVRKHVPLLASLMTAAGGCICHQPIHAPDSAHACGTDCAAPPCRTCDWMGLMDETAIANTAEGPPDAPPVISRFHPVPVRPAFAPR
jgi:hypothetical protein